MLVSSKKMLLDAKAKGYAVGAFNTSNLEMTQAIISAAEELRAPVIVQTSEKAIEYAGIDTISLLVRNLANKAKVPVALHLDHGDSVQIAQACIQNGYTSVMIDASAKPFEENVRLVQQVKKFAYWKSVQVEAELGRLQGVEDKVNVSKEQAFYTDPQEAKKYVELTHCDSLAVAIGTSHGPFKFTGKSWIRLDILKQINEICNIPLVLHGASSVPQEYVKKINKYGGKIKSAHGVDDELLKGAIANGVCKINTDTDLRLVFDAVLREFLAKEPQVYDPRTILTPPRDEIKKYVMHKISSFGGEGKAEGIR
jgi:fructose-bisphosphate aldolase, class II